VIADARRTLAELERGMHATRQPTNAAAEASPQLGLFAPASHQPSSAHWKRSIPMR
jgi:DNA mismatch repair protein MutS